MYPKRFKELFFEMSNSNHCGFISRSFDNYPLSAAEPEEAEEVMAADAEEAGEEQNGDEAAETEEQEAGEGGEVCDDAQKKPCLSRLELRLPKWSWNCYSNTR